MIDSVTRPEFNLDIKMHGALVLLLKILLSLHNVFMLIYFGCIFTVWGEPEAPGVFC